MNLFGLWSKTSFVAANQAATGMETNNSSKNLQSLNRNKICWCDNSGWLVLQITTLVLMIQTVDVCLQRHAELETGREMARRKMTTNLLLWCHLETCVAVVTFHMSEPILGQSTSTLVSDAADEVVFWIYGQWVPFQHFPLDELCVIAKIHWRQRSISCNCQGMNGKDRFHADCDTKVIKKGRMRDGKRKAKTCSMSIWIGPASSSPSPSPSSSSDSLSNKPLELLWDLWKCLFKESGSPKLSWQTGQTHCYPNNKKRNRWICFPSFWVACPYTIIVRGDNLLWVTIVKRFSIRVPQCGGLLMHFTKVVRLGLPDKPAKVTQVAVSDHSVLIVAHSLQNPLKGWLKKSRKDWWERKGKERKENRKEGGKFSCSGQKCSRNKNKKEIKEDPTIPHTSRSCEWQYTQALEGLNVSRRWHWQHTLQAKKWKEKSSFDTHRPRKTAISRQESELKGLSTCVRQYKQALEGLNGSRRWHWQDKSKMKKERKSWFFRHRACKTAISRQESEWKGVNTCVQ